MNSDHFDKECDVIYRELFGEPYPTDSEPLLTSTIYLPDEEINLFSKILDYAYRKVMVFLKL